jgi:predicted dehydrogenase
MSKRIGILGFAHGHVGMYCTQWRANPVWGVSLIAGWDHDAARLKSAAEQHQVEPAPSAAALLSRSDIDAVVIGAETAYHADLAVQAAKAGKAIILQKPMALTLAEADRIVEAVQHSGVPFTLAWQMRVDAQNLAIRQIIESGDLGRIYMVRRRHGLSTQLWGDGFKTSWHASKTLNRGMWADDAAHPIDMLLWLFGEPETVTAEVATLRSPDVPDDNGIAIFRYRDGMFAEVCSSFVTVMAENTMEVIAEHGSIVQNYGDQPSASAPREPNTPGVKWYKRGDTAWRTVDIPSPSNQGQRIAALSQPLADWLNGKRDAIATAAEGRAALRMLLASYHAANTGSRVRIADIESTMNV